MEVTNMSGQFDTPRTKAMTAFLQRERGRVTGLSIESDGVFIYTDSAEWCDDAGAGTFRGDSETQAIRHFYERVQRSNANSHEPANPYVETLDGFEFMPRLDDSTQYSTVYRGARPMGTLQRRRVMERSGPVWTLYATDGTLLKRWFHRPSYVALARGASYQISKFLGE
jgi:hypothetical protein